MALELVCPVEGCDAICSGDTEGDILEQGTAHAGDAHPDLELDDETVAAIKDDIEEV